MVRVRLDVAYDGTDFSGWADQPDQRTVAGVLTEGLTRLFGTPTGLTVAGRTDAGVHATGQVCHVDLPAEAWRAQSVARRGKAETVPRPDAAAGPGVPAEPGVTAGPGVAGVVASPGGGGEVEAAATVVRRLAGVLPADVRVTAVAVVPAEFDARFSAVRRRYAYRVGDEPWGVSPVRRRDTLAWPWRLDPAPMNLAARALVGEHDFAAYCRRKEYGTTIRTLQRLEWHRGADGILVATVEADAFCQAMVRSLVGALLPVGDGRRPIDWPGSLLARRERASEVVVAPAYGLTLVGVDYPDHTEYATRATATRNRRT